MLVIKQVVEWSPPKHANPPEDDRQHGCHSASLRSTAFSVVCSALMCLNIQELPTTISMSI